VTKDTVTVDWLTYRLMLSSSLNKTGTGTDLDLDLDLLCYLNVLNSRVAVLYR